MLVQGQSRVNLKIKGDVASFSKRTLHPVTLVVPGAPARIIRARRCCVITPVSASGFRGYDVPDLSLCHASSCASRRPRDTPPRHRLGDRPAGDLPPAGNSEDFGAGLGGKGGVRENSFRCAWIADSLFSRRGARGMAPGGPPGASASAGSNGAGSSDERTGTGKRPPHL